MGMKFEKALKEMKKGIPMKLPSWGGYWCWDEETQTISCTQRTISVWISEKRRELSIH